MPIRDHVAVGVLLSLSLSLTRQAILWCDVKRTASFLAEVSRFLTLSVRNSEPQKEREPSAL